jgi:hypothetical protein
MLIDDLDSTIFAMERFSGLEQLQMEMIQAQWPSTINGIHSLKAHEFGLLARSGVRNRPSMSSRLESDSTAFSCIAHCEQKKNLCVLILHEN